MKDILSNKFFVIIALVFVCFCRNSYSDISSIEVAIIEQDYEKAKGLAIDLINTSKVQSVKDDASYYLGLSYLNLRDYVKAEKIFADLIKSNLNDRARDKAYLGLFDSYYLQEKYDDALGEINKLLRISPTSESLSLIYLKAGRVNLKLAKWGKARKYLRKIITSFPHSLEYHTAKQLLEEKQYFAVQVGAFLDRELAEKLANEFKEKREYAYIVETKDRRGRKFYRVRVGKMSVLNDAQALKIKLANQGYPALVYP